MLLRYYKSFNLEPFKVSMMLLTRFPAYAEYDYYQHILAMCEIARLYRDILTVFRC